MQSQAEDFENYDLVIVGAGVVGALIALLVAQDEALDYSIAVVDPIFAKRQLKSADLEDVLDRADYWRNRSRRVSAVNHSLFSQLSQALPINISDIAKEMTGMQVFSPECGGQFSIDAAEYGDSPLAWVMSNDELCAALISSLTQFNQVTLIAEKVCEVAQLAGLGSGYQINTCSRRIRSSRLVAADGASSKVRQQFGFTVQHVGNPALAVSAQVEVPFLKDTSQAVQWFFRDGSVLGLLPVAGSSSVFPVMSAVWSMPAGFAIPKDLSAENLKARLLDALSQSGNSHFSKGLEVVSMPQVWPLKRHLFNGNGLSLSHPGLFFVGDAAHVIHPLAGQGLNLGLQDAFLLHQAFQDLSDAQYSLERIAAHFTAARSISSRHMLWLCEGLRAIFEKKIWPLAFVGALAFKGFDRHTLLKKKVVELMSYQ